jgi:hypothetical protein
VKVERLVANRVLEFLQHALSDTELAGAECDVCVIPKRMRPRKVQVERRDIGVAGCLPSLCCAVVCAERRGVRRDICEGTPCSRIVDLLMDGRGFID